MARVSLGSFRVLIELPIALQKGRATTRRRYWLLTAPDMCFHEVDKENTILVKMFYWRTADVGGHVLSWDEVSLLFSLRTNKWNTTVSD